MQVNYSAYLSVVADAVKRRDLSGFKSTPEYRGILEHCSPEFGLCYYNLLHEKYGMKHEDIERFCDMNDALGSPIKHVIGDVYTSPASLLYLYHAMQTLDHMEDDVDVVEVGCGYGGYVLALDFVSKLRNRKIRSYTCVDLDGPLRLQELYLQNFTVSFPIWFHSASTHGQHIPKRKMFLVSIYCFSEIDKEHQIRYMKHLFPKVDHGFLLWNHIPLFDFGKPVKLVEPENPRTGPGNLLVVF